MLPSETNALSFEVKDSSLRYKTNASISQLIRFCTQDEQLTLSSGY